MKKFILFLVTALMLISPVIADQPDCNAGSMQTTDASNSGGDKPQYLLGEDVYLRASNMPDGIYTYEIYHGPNEKTSTLATSGTVNIIDGISNPNPKLIWTVPTDEPKGPHRVLIYSDDCKKQKEIHVGESVIPEFSTLTALTALTLAVLGFIYLRRK